MTLFIRMVVGCRLVKITEHIAGGFNSLLVSTLGLQVNAQPLQQAQYALHPLVAGLQHFERGFVARTGRTMAGHGDGVQVDTGHGMAVLGRHQSVDG